MEKQLVVSKKSVVAGACRNQAAVAGTFSEPVAESGVKSTAYLENLLAGLDEDIRETTVRFKASPKDERFIPRQEDAKQQLRSVQNPDQQNKNKVVANLQAQ